MIDVQTLINQLAKFPRGARVLPVNDNLLVMLKSNTGVIHLPNKGRQRKLDMGDFAGWTDMVTEPDSRIYAWLATCPEQALDLAVAAVLNLYMEDGEPWLGNEGDFPSGADYVNTMTEAMESCGLYPLINKLQNEADAALGISDA